MVPLTVQQVVGYLKELIESNATLGDLWISGEISNLSRSSAGHIYFTLKDEAAQLRCAFFRRANAGMKLEHGDAVIAHGTSTRKGDEAEINAINQLFGERPIPIPVTSIKGHMGHPGAASGSLAIITAVLALHAGSMVHTAGTTEVEDSVRFEVITGTPKTVELRHVLVNAFGFGGQNASVVIGR